MTLRKFKSLTLICTVALITMLAGCKKSTYYQLTDDEMTWLAYKNNEVLKFSNGSGSYMNYYVTLRTKAYERDGDVYSEFTSASFLQLNDTTALYSADSQGELFIFKGELGFIVTLKWPHFPLNGLPLTNLTPSIENIGGINYTDVYVVDASGFTDARNYISILWVSKSKGVLQMQDTAGNTWVRDI